MPESVHQLRETLETTLENLVEDGQRLAFSDGALETKYKMLIALALDASRGAIGRVEFLAEAATKAGASTEEISEALRVTEFMGGIGNFYTVSRAPGDLPGAMSSR